MVRGRSGSWPRRERYLARMGRATPSQQSATLALPMSEEDEVTRDTDPVTTIIRSFHNEVVQQLSVAPVISHRGESGRAREGIIRKYLERFVPSGFSIDTGIVVDSRGGISRQIDIIIHRNDYHPTFEVGGVKHFMVESVVAVIENKAVIDSRADLRDALANVRSVKALDRSGEGTNYVVLDFHRKGKNIDPADPEHRVWTAVITEKGPSRSLFLEEIERDQSTQPIELWLNSFIAVHDFSMRYLNVAKNTHVHYPQEADTLVLSAASDRGSEQPLVDFAALLADRLRYAPIIDFKAGRYFPMTKQYSTRVPLRQNGRQ